MEDSKHFTVRALQLSGLSLHNIGKPAKVIKESKKYHVVMKLNLSVKDFAE